MAEFRWPQKGAGPGKQLQPPVDAADAMQRSSCLLPRPAELCERARGVQLGVLSEPAEVRERWPASNRELGGGRQPGRETGRETEKREVKVSVDNPRTTKTAV